jgi:hypothetical protein
MRSHRHLGVYQNESDQMIRPYETVLKVSGVSVQVSGYSALTPCHREPRMKLHKIQNYLSRS